MKKRLTILTLFITLCTCVFAQNNYHWEIDPYFKDVAINESCLLSVYIDDEMQTSANIEIGAFYDGKVGGRIRINEKVDIAMLALAGHPGETFTFKLYDHSIGQELECVSENTLTYINGYVNHGTIEVPVDIRFYYVASITDNNGTTTKYATLDKAVETAEAGQTVKLLRNATGPGLVIDKNITIDFNEKTYTFNKGAGDIPSNGFQIKEDNYVTLKNGTLNVAEEAANKFYTIIQNYANLNVENMTLDGTNLDKWSTVPNNEDSYTLSINSGSVNITGNTKIIANNDGNKAFAFDVCKYQKYEAPVVTLGENVTVNGKVELTGGQLYTNVEGLDVVAKKQIKGVQAEPGSTIGWNTISTPIENAEIPEATTGVHDLYRYDEPTMTWQYYKANVGDGDVANPYNTLDLGRGYLYINTNDITIALEGELNVDEVTFPLSYTEGLSVAGFNMVGNPFAHNISSDNFYTSSATLASGFYLIGDNGEWLARPAGHMIAPMESVLVKADKADNLVIMPEANTNERANTEEQQYLAINVANANYNDIAYVSFNKGLGLDKISHRNETAPMVSVPVEGKEFAIAMMNNEVTEIPVTFVAKTMGEYTIGVEAEKCDYSRIILVDRLTGNETNMLLEDYTFMATSNDNADRFLIKLSMESDTDTNTENFAFINNGNIIINNIEGQGVIKVFDVTGRSVSEYTEFESAVLPAADYNTGMYIIQMSDGNGLKVQKIVIE